MRKQPLPRSQLRQAILKCVVVSSASSLIVSANLSIAQINTTFSVEPSACDFTYGVNDAGLNNSQLFRINPSTYKIEPIGPVHDGYDLEALDVSASGEIYLAAGDNSDVGQPGYLYKADPVTGDLIEVCSTGYAEIDGISFNPVSGELYGWAQDAGLIRITPNFLPVEKCADLIYETPGEFEDLTWSNDGTTLYVVKNDHGAYPHPVPYTTEKATYFPDPENDASVPHELIAYNVMTGIGVPICEKVIEGLGEIEAMEIDTSNNLLIGYHSSGNKFMMATLVPETCDISTQLGPTYPTDTAIEDFGDVEALGVCFCDNPSQTDWQYAYDPPRDASGLRDLEIYGMAIKVEGGNIIVAVTANMPASGVDVPTNMIGKNKVVDGNVAFSDMVFTFANGNQVAAHFSPGNDSGVTELGLYNHLELKDTTKENFGHSSLANYLSVLEAAGSGIHPTVGEIGLPTDFFPMNADRSLAMSIAVGTKVPGDDFKVLNESELKAKGLDFKNGLNTNKIGDYTFGFSFKKSRYMNGRFIASVFTECSNDGIAIIGEVPDC